MANDVEPCGAEWIAEDVEPCRKEGMTEDVEHRKIVNSRFLERPQKRSHRNQLIHRRLAKTKSIGSGQDPESQAGRQSDGSGGWCLEFIRGGWYEEDDESG